MVCGHPVGLSVLLEYIWKMFGGEYMTAAVLPEPGYGMAEVAELTGYGGKYVYELAQKGKLRTYRGVDGKLKVSRMALELFLQEREK
jgi:hypothetical protein